MSQIAHTVTAQRWVAQASRTPCLETPKISHPFYHRKVSFCDMVIGPPEGRKHWIRLRPSDGLLLRKRKRYLYGRQIRIIMRVLREIEGIVEVPEMGEGITGSEGWTSGMTVSGVVVGARSGGIKPMIDAGKGR